MKKFCFAVMFLSLGLFTIGCNEPAKPKTDTKPTTPAADADKGDADKADADKPADAGTPAPADGAIADPPAEPADPAASTDAPAEEK